LSVQGGFVAVLIVLGVLLAAFFLVLGYLIEFRFDFRRSPVLPQHGRREFLRGHEPFELGTGDRAVLMLHGIAGSPAQLRGMAEGLAAEGFHVYGVALPGHGTDFEDLYGISWQRWYAHVEAEYRRVAERHGSVSVVGFSLGATLGLRLAVEHPVERLVCMSAPIYLFHDYLPSHWLLRAASLISHTARTFPKRQPESDLPGSQVPEYLIYHHVPFDALFAVVDLVKESQSRLGEVTAPTLILHSRRDPASRPKSARYIYENIGSKDKRLVWLGEAPHGMMHGSDADRAVVRHEVLSFLS